jgi:hypothetical protein
MNAFQWYDSFSNSQTRWFTYHGNFQGHEVYPNSQRNDHVLKGRLTARRPAPAGGFPKCPGRRGHRPLLASIMLLSIGWASLGRCP